MQDQVLQGLYEAYFGAGQPIFEAAELTGLAAAAGLDPAEAAQVLADGGYADAVRDDEAQAARSASAACRSRSWTDGTAVSGAQAAETFTAALDRAWSESHSGA